MWLLMISLLVLVLASGWGLWYFSNKVIRIGVWNEDRITEFESQNGTLDVAYMESLPKEEVQIPSPYGYQLEGWYIPAKEPSRYTMILVHGVTRSRLTSIKYVELFRKRGFNVLVYDHRRHGRSGGNSTSFGQYEQVDLKACVDWILEHKGPDPIIGIHGESMGAATALLHAAMDNRAAFYIADCPYSDFAEQLRYRLKVEYRILPAFPIIPLVGWLCRLRSGFSLKEAAPIQSITRVETPILFIHGANDTYVPTPMSEAMYQAKPGYKKLYLAPNADHAEALLKNPEDYDRIVGVFLQDIGVTGPELNTSLI